MIVSGLALIIGDFLAAACAIRATWPNVITERVSREDSIDFM